MVSHNFLIANVDTDAIAFNKPDGSPFSPQERESLLKELNDISPELITWEDDGYFPVFCVFKAKNYVMYDGKKIKTKGSALRDSKKEMALKDMQKEVIDSIVFEKFNYVDIYNKYVKEVCSLTTPEQIKRYASKKTYTKKIDDSERTNETKIKDALEGSDYKEGDKLYLIFDEDESLILIENFKGTYNKDRMLEKVYKSMQIFKSVLDISGCLNYSLKKNKKALDQLLSS